MNRRKGEVKSQKSKVKSQKLVFCAHEVSFWAEAS